MFETSLPLIAALLALLAGLAIGKAWERYKLRDGKWIDRRRARDSRHYVLGLNFLVSGQVDLAIEELSQAARLDADALEIHLILGNVYRERGQVAKAIQTHQALLQRSKLTRLEHAYVLLCLGLDYKRGGFVDRALDAFHGVLRLDPENPYALLYLQKLHEEQHQWGEAYAVGQQLASIADSELARRNVPVLAFLENAIGVAALERREPGEAQRHFASAIALAPATVPAHLHTGDLRLQQGDLDGALAAWDQLLTLAPDRAHLALGRLERLATDAAGALRFQERCARVIAANPQDWRARLSLGRFLTGQDRANEAFKPLFDALDHNPHGLSVHQQIWATLLQAGLDRRLVQRYVEAARERVFFLDPHVCVKCHYRATELLWRCPHCHEWNTFVEERGPAAKENAEL